MALSGSEMPGGSAALKPRGIFVDNRWAPCASGEAIEVLAPATGQVIGRIAAGDEADVDLAVAAARHAFELGDWSRLSATERGRLLTRLSGLILDHAQELADIECADTGRPRAQGVADMTALARYFEYYGGAADKLHGETIPYLNGFFAATEREPLGVTGHIIPWNYPAQMFGRTLAPALAVGNATVVKPAEDACLSILRIAELTVLAGFPPGAINIVPGRGEQAGAALSRHRGIDFIAFTGSPQVGTLVQIEAARNHIGCTMELGGKSPHLVFADADLDQAAPAIVRGIVQNAGQTCSAGSRVLIEARVYDAFIERLAAEFALLVAGPPEAGCDLGPVISAKQQQRVEEYMRQAEADGIAVAAQSPLHPDADPRGFFVKPTLYGRVPADNRLAVEEVFGPILAAMPFDDEAHAVRLANGTPYGLMAGVWTRDGARALRAARAIRAGQVYVNGFAAGGGVELPFGGMKKSGHGREKGFEALYDYSTLKTIILKHGTDEGL